MLKFVFGVFIILHRLVHLLYFGQSQRYFELQDGMTWPDGAWAFSRFIGNESIRSLANILCVVAAILCCWQFGDVRELGSLAHNSSERSSVFIDHQFASVERENTKVG